MPRRAWMLVLLLIAASPPSAAGDEGVVLPSFTEGAVAEYGGTRQLNVTIGPVGEVLDRAARRVEAVPIDIVPGRASGFVQHVSTASGLLEREDQVCSVSRSDGDCYTSYDWSSRYGLPGLWGATLLQSRALRVGDAWTIESPCGGCLGATRIQILAPDEGSPPGADLVAEITVHRTHVWAYSSARLHMDDATPFPLLIETSRDSFALQAWKAGAAPITILTLPAAQYPPPLAAVPRSGDLPPEGETSPYNASWAGARLDPTGLRVPHVDGALHGVMYFVNTLRTGLYPTGTAVRVEDQYLWSETWWTPQGGVDIDHEARVAIPRASPYPQPAWTTTTSAADVSAAPCAPDTVPMWDLARYAESLQVTTTPFRGFDLELDCDRPEFTYIADCPIRTCEQLVMDPRDGMLEWALVWPHPFHHWPDGVAGIHQPIPGVGP